jgi:ketosteroid isomerase-like protein
MPNASEDIAAGYRAFEQVHFNGMQTPSPTYSDDAQLLLPQVPIVCGREAIAQVWTRRDLIRA